LKAQPLHLLGYGDEDEVGDGSPAGDET
jgi:hypothetical protein